MTKFKITGTECDVSGDTNPSDHGEFDYEFEIINKPNGPNIFQLFGGPTGHESFVMHEATVTAMKEHGWRACTGTPGSYNRLSFTAKQMKAAFEQVDVITEPPTREEIDFEIEIAKRNAKRDNVFCPLRNAMCRIDCEAYYQPRIGPSERVSGGFCTASVLRAPPE